MTSVLHEPARSFPEARSPWLRLLVPELWPSLAIVGMWLAVLFDAIFGPDIVSTNSAPGQSTTVPSAVAVALFAFLGTWVVARHGFGDRKQRD
jgi:hypothetical protein